jgi:hypothetical protein
MALRFLALPDFIQASLSLSRTRLNQHSQFRSGELPEGRDTP